MVDLRRAGGDVRLVRDHVEHRELLRQHVMSVARDLAYTGPGVVAEAVADIFEALQATMILTGVTEEDVAAAVAARRAEAGGYIGGLVVETGP